MENNISASKEQQQQAQQNKQKSSQAAETAGTDKKLRGPNRPSV